MWKQPSHSWWFDRHNSPRRSPWLHSTLSELDEKTKAMLKLIEEDADSFAQRAEMYYKKRPELITMVEDFYRAHRSLAERFDQLKSDNGTRLTTPSGSPFSIKYQSQKSTILVEQSYKNYFVASDLEESGESEVEDPEHEEETQVDSEMEEEVSSGVSDIELKLREEIERLKEEKKIQQDQLLQKDEEKREVIRQLSIAMEFLKEENVHLKKCIITKESSKKRSPFEFNKLKGFFSGKFFSGSSRTQIASSLEMGLQG